MGLGTNNMTVTTGTVFRPNIWAQSVMSFLKKNIVLVDLIRHYDREIKSAGQTVEIPFISNLVANDKSAGSQVTLQSPTETKVTITINKHKETSFFVEDILAAQASYDLLSEYTEDAAYAIAEQMDTDVAAIINSTAGNTVGAYGTALTDANILLGKRYIDEAKAPRTNRYFVVSAQGEAELLAIDRYTRYDALGVGGDQNAIAKGAIGRIYGFEVYMSQNVPITAGTPTQNNHLMFHKDCAAIAIQKQPRVQSQYKLEYLSNLVVVDALYGVAGLRATFAVKVKS